MNPEWEHIVNEHIIVLRDKIIPLDLLPHLKCLTKSDKVIIRLG